jgi:hypothetical protein
MATPDPTEPARACNSNLCACGGGLTPARCCRLNLQSLGAPAANRHLEPLEKRALKARESGETEAAERADRNFKRPSGPRLPTTLLRVTSLMLRPSLGPACLAWAIRAAGAPPRRAPGH